MSKWLHTKKDKKEPKPYIPKSTKVISFLKQKVKQYPSSYIKYELFLSECALELEVGKKDIEKNLEMFHDVGLIKMKGDKIISVPAEQSALVAQKARESMKKKLVTPEQFEEILNRPMRIDDNDKKVDEDVLK